VGILHIAVCVYNGAVLNAAPSQVELY